MAPPRGLNDESAVQWWRNSEGASVPRHAGGTDGADRTGDATGQGAVTVSLGVWMDRLGRVRRVRWNASAPGESDALIAYAEVACDLLESGVAPASVDAAALRRLVTGTAKADEPLADLVASAVAAALRPALF